MAAVGGVPNVRTDIPVCAVLMAIYLSFAAIHQFRNQHNRKRGHKFLIEVFLFGFCMARMGTMVLRIAWATRPHNIRLGIAAGVFVNAGTLILYVINLVLAQRILRAENPTLGWNKVLRGVFKAFYVGIVIFLGLVIASLVLSVYTLNEAILKVCADIQHAAGIFNLIFVSLPMMMMAAAGLLPNREPRDVFGAGTLFQKKLVVLLSASSALLIAGFKCGTGWMPPRPRTDPAWYQSKAAFYVFFFCPEILILCVFTIARVDRMFFVPNGCKGPGDYSRLREQSTDQVETVQKETA